MLLLASAMSRAAEVDAVVAATTPVVVTSSLVSPDSEASPACRTVECACRHVRATSMVRLVGEFGQFRGSVSRWSADSLSGFSADPDWGGATPEGALAWSQVIRVEKRTSDEGRGAIIGAVVLGSITALLAALASAPAAVFTSLGGDHSAADRITGRAALGGAVIGGLLGAGVGAAIGSGSHRWELVYVRR
jgi:surface antigen